jgi:hypothetical protein
MASIFSSVTTVGSSVSGGSMSGGWRIDRSHIIRDMALGASALSLRAVRGRIERLNLLRVDRHQTVVIFEIVKFPLSDLFSNDVDITREVDFLSRLDDETRD